MLGERNIRSRARATDVEKPVIGRGIWAPGVSRGYTNGESPIECTGRGYTDELAGVLGGGGGGVRFRRD